MREQQAAGVLTPTTNQRKSQPPPHCWTRRRTTTRTYCTTIHTTNKPFSLLSYCSTTLALLHLLLRNNQQQQQQQQQQRSAVFASAAAAFVAPFSSSSPCFSRVTTLKRRRHCLFFESSSSWRSDPTFHRTSSSSSSSWLIPPQYGYPTRMATTITPLRSRTFAIKASTEIEQQQQQQQQEIEMATRERHNVSTHDENNNNNNDKNVTTNNEDVMVVIDNATWQAYCDIMVQHIMENERVLGKKLMDSKPDEAKPVQDYLLDRSSIIMYNADGGNQKNDGWNDDETKNKDFDFRKLLSAKRDEFRSNTSSNNNTNFTLAQYEYLTRCLNYLADWCARRQQPAPALVGWYKLRQAAILPRENCVSTYMYCFTLGGDDSSTTTTTTLLSSALNAASVQAASFHDFLFPPNEKTMTLRIKALIAQGNATDAEAILDSLPQKQQQQTSGKNKKKNDHDDQSYQRLRTFAPIFAHYCETAQIVPMLKLFRKMRQSKGVLLDTETYSLMIQTLAMQKCFAKNGIFQNYKDSNMNPIIIADKNKAAPAAIDLHQHDDHDDGTTIAGFTISNGPILFNEIAHEMAQDILELPESCAQMIHDALVMGFSRRDDKNLKKEERNEDDGTSTAVPPARQINDRSSAGENEGGNVLIGRVTINETTATCPATHAKLRLFSLTTSQRQEMRETLLDMAKTRHEEYSEKLKSRTKNRDNDDVVEAGEYAFQQLLAFSEWLSKGRLDESTDNENDDDDAPYTAIVDGPNIGYYGHGDVHYSQVQCVVDELERMGEKVLVVMPFKYVASNFYLCSLSKVQNLTEREEAIMNRLIATKRLYQVPAKCLDDYYWMMASVIDQQTRSSAMTLTDDGQQLQPPQRQEQKAQLAQQHVVHADNAQGRFPGLRPMLISNDLMRDHWLSLLEPRLFRRWRSCHILNYDIKPYVDNEWEERKVEFVPADFFSREIQGNALPAVRDDVVAEDSGNEDNNKRPLVWHFPVTGWDEPDRLCICINP